MTTGRRPSRGWRATSRFVGPPLLLACTVVFGFTYFLLVYLPAEKRQAVEAWSGRLSAMAEDRSAVVTHWVAEKVRDAAALARNPDVGALVKESGGTAGAGAGERRRLLLDRFSRTEGYLAAYVLDTSGAVVAQTSGSPPIEASCVALAGRVLTRGTVAAAFHALADGTTAVAFAVPIPPLADGNERPAGKSPGVVVLEADPSHWLYPFLVREPTATATGEVLLARMEADEIVFLSPLRNNPGRPLTVRVAAAKFLAAVAALRAGEVFRESLDYRGVPVFAATRPIPATSWGLVAKVAQEEALAGYRKEVRQSALFLAGVVLGLAGAVFGLWRDRRARLETAVTQSEQRFALLRDHANDAVVFTRKDGRLYDVNRAAEELYGYPREDLIGLDMRTVLPESARAVSAPAMVSGGGDQGVVFEVVHLRRDGTPFPVEISSHPVEVDGEEMSLSIIRDITVRRRAEEALHASEQRYRSLVESLRDAYVRTEMSGLIVDYNAVFRELLGYSDDELRKTTYQDITPARWHESNARIISEQIVPRGFSDVYEKEYRRKDGTIVPVELRTSLIRDRMGAPSGVWAIVRDITDRKRSEEALQASEQRYRFIATRTSDGIFTVDLEGRITFVSPHWLAEGGYTEADVLGRRMVDFVPEEYRALAWEKFTRALAGEEIGLYEIPLLRADGSSRSFELSMSSLTDESGEITGRVGVFRDITERKRAEEALRKSEAKYRQLFEGANDAIVIFEPDSERILEVNPKTCEIYGFSREELLGMSLKQLTVNVARGEARIAEVMRSGSTHNFETVRVRRDGAHVHFLANAVLVDFAGKKAVLSIDRDVSEWKQAQERIGLLAAVVEQAAEAVLMTDTAGKIMYVNPAFTRVTGYTPEEVLGQNPRILNSGKQPKEFYRELWDTILSGNTWHGHFVNRRKDGSLYEEDAVISPVRDPAGKITYLVAVKRDVTQEVMLEAQLRQAQKLEAIGRLAGGVAHDFNNLLQAMLGNTQLLRTGVVEKQQVASAAADLEEQIWRGASLTRQLLLFSRREAPRLEPLDINDVVRDAAKLLRRLVRENITLEVRVADTPLVVEADRGQLAQVVMDLAVNASDSMPGGGHLVISTGPLDPDTVVLSVADTGHGVPDEIRDRIFDPFFTTKGVGKGTGLGLSVAHGIVAQHGGRIELESRVGEGSTFRVLIPRNIAGQSASVAKEGLEFRELPQGRGERILLVEDEDGARKGLRAMLVLLGYDVVAEGSAEEAGKLPVHPPFDLLLSDVVLPGATGHELSRGLVDRWPGLKVILISGYMEDEVLREVIAKGGVRFLRKPFDMAALAREVRAALDEGTS
jgi:two-component system, cell cycle sensor histidine kinase and response regulator CckA